MVSSSHAQSSASTVRLAGSGSAAIHVLLHPRQPTAVPSEWSFIHSSEAPHHQRRPSARCPSSTSHHSFIRVVHVVLRPREPSAAAVWIRHTLLICLLEDDMAPRDASGKGKRNGGSGDSEESQKGRGHVPKSKRPRFDDKSSEHTGDVQGEEVSMVDAQGADVMNHLGFGRDGVSREQPAALKRSLVGGVAVTLARTPKAAGIAMTDACVARQVPPKVGQVQPRQPLPALQQAGTSRVEKTLSAQKVDTTAGSGRTAAADHTTGSGVVEAAEEGRVDEVRRDDGRKDGRGGGDDDDVRPVSTMVKKVIKPQRQVEVVDRLRCILGSGTGEAVKGGGRQLHGLLRGHRERRCRSRIAFDAGDAAE
ncbi:hypothetical protein CBR_g6474 [Chara braunii]|uniref:Uncharacterized protein n=1 Tax=Chara braunii TaxID=69332 RepID=A0A388KJZ4_CHABU|nr:hypothetical protein CBR_g6474 [Chara braunii]|eukprot:GBG70346.1 hypothetical protein CBR_g6474 [Chara braunii]